MSLHETKKKFSKIIKFINKNQKIKNELTSEILINLKFLIKMWNNNNNQNMEYYFKMKDHHSHINGRIKNKILDKMWIEYLKCGLKFRLELMKSNYKSSNKLNHTFLPPKNIKEAFIRQTIINKNKNKKEIHCIICGDTEKDGKIVKVNSIDGSHKYFCQDCYDIQINM